MSKQSIALHFRRYDYEGLAIFGQGVHNGLAISSVYTSPPVSLPQQQSDIDELKLRIAAWGTSGNRGSTLSLQLLRDQREVVRGNLKKLSLYCMMVTPEDATAWTEAGFVTGRIKSKSVTLQPVQNFYQVFAHNLPRTFVKLKWGRPMEAMPRENIIYKILRSADANAENAVYVGVVAKTSFMDQPPQTGINFYYWVLPVNASGNGVLSDICTAVALPM